MYEQILQETITLVGHPRYRGQDADEAAHQHAVWRTPSALFILQQCAFDLQFGVELNFWIESYLDEPFIPTTPFIDWLVQHNGFNE